MNNKIKKVFLGLLSFLLLDAITVSPALAGYWYAVGSNIYNTNSGKVGIGTAAPEAKFHIKLADSGATPFTDALVFENSGSAYLQILGGASSERTLVFGDSQNNADGGIKYNAADGPTNGMSFTTNGNIIRMVINSSGNVGIGTTAPQYKLHVAGTSFFDNYVKVSLWGGNAAQSIYRNSNYRLAFQSSDLRLKTNIKPINDSLAKINGINGVLFNWKTDPDGAQKTVGVIAQDVLKVLPEAVFTDKDESGKEYYGVHYEKLTALLIDGVKDQQEEINDLQQRLQLLKEKLNNK